MLNGDNAPGGTCDVLTFVRCETFSLDEHHDAYSRGWIAAMAHVERHLERRTLACLRELRSALCVETVRTPVLFEAMHVEGEWE